MLSSRRSQSAVFPYRMSAPKPARLSGLTGFDDGRVDEARDLRGGVHVGQPREALAGRDVDERSVGGALLDERTVAAEVRHVAAQHAHTAGDLGRGGRGDQHPLVAARALGHVGVHGVVVIR